MHSYYMVMSIGNQKLVYQENTNTNSVFGCPKFLDNFLEFYWNFEEALVKIWLNIGIFSRIKIGLYLVSVVAISLVSVWFRFEFFSQNGHL